MVTSLGLSAISVKKAGCSSWAAGDMFWEPWNRFRPAGRKDLANGLG